MRMPSPMTFLLGAIIVMLVAGAFTTIAMADDSVDARPGAKAIQGA